MDKWKERAETWQKKLLDFAEPTRWFGGRRPAQGEIHYARFNERVFASTLDMLLSLFLLFPVFYRLAGVLFGQERANLFFSFNLGVTPEQLAYYTNQPGYWVDWMLNNLIQMAVLGGLFIFCWVKAQATPGKWLMRMRIVDAATLGKPTMRQWIIRFLGSVVSFLCLGLGFFWIVWDKKKRAWHDLMAGTVVIKVKHWRFHYTPPMVEEGE